MLLADSDKVVCMDMRMVLGMIAMVALLSPVAVLGLTGSSPSIGSMGITPEDPGTGDDLTCSAVISDSDGDLDTATLRWLVNGIAERTISFGISGSSATVTDTLGSSFTEANDLVECIVTAEDMQGRVTQEDASVRIASGSELPKS